ncbi:hypothetical protein [Gracilibacillus phocaeensis]|uniref:hypothetical protein n=1 Tax=Gracilibacillus phocaeensis TaxID=2042304 RepID=UPI001030E6E4|nr:hypothetical protein [Gracilibacillus phocaeensis]
MIREIGEAATEQGLERGMEQGMEQGMERGREEGKLEGIEEAERNVAKKLIDRDYSDEEISELTSLELKEVTKLRKSLEH